MLGWMMIFAFFTVLAAVMELTANPKAASNSPTLAAVLFGALFLLCVLTRVVRGRV